MFPTGISVLGDPEVAEGLMGEVSQFANKVSFMRHQSGLDYIYKSHFTEDGALVRVVENEWVRLVYVDVRNVRQPKEGETPSGDDDSFIDHGIGFAFTAPDDALVPGFERLAADGTPLGIPTPVVLIEQIDREATGFLRGTGNWRAVKVRELWGGNTVWVNADRTEWFSCFADEWHRPPDVNQSPSETYWRAGWFSTGGQVEEYQLLWPGPHLLEANFDLSSQLGSVARGKYIFTGHPGRRPSVRLASEFVYTPPFRTPSGKVGVCAGSTVRQGYGDPSSTLRIYNDDTPTGPTAQYGQTLVAEVTYDESDGLLPSFEHLHVNRAGSHAVCLVQPIEFGSAQVRYEHYAVVNLESGAVTITATPTAFFSDSGTDHGTGVDHTLTSVVDKTQTILAYYNRDDALRFVVETNATDIAENHDASHFDMDGGGTRSTTWDVGGQSYTMYDESWSWVLSKENVGTEEFPDYEAYWVSRSGTRFERWCLFFDPLHNVLVFAEQTISASLTRDPGFGTPSCAITVWQNHAQVYSHEFTIGSGTIIVNEQGVTSTAHRPQLDTSAYSATEPATGSLMLVLQNEAIEWATTLIFDATGMKTLSDVIAAAPDDVKVAFEGNLTNLVSI